MLALRENDCRCDTETNRTKYRYDSQQRLRCVGTSPGACDLVIHHYDPDGTRIREVASVGGETVERIFLGDLFEWVTDTNTAVSYVFAFGRRVGFRVQESASLRTAWQPVAWPLPVPPKPFFGALGVLAGALLLALLVRSGTLAAMAQQPATAAVILGVAASLAPASAWAGGGGGGGGTTYKRWLFPDHLGSATLVTDSAGNVIHRRVFEPFGKLFGETSPTENTPRLFTGQRHEAVSGLYDFKARWYDPDTGRFLSIDPIVQDVGDPQTHNPYTYVRNNPIAFVDPTGSELFSAIIIALVITAAYVTVAVNIITAVVGGILLAVGEQESAFDSFNFGLALLGLKLGDENKVRLTQIEIKAWTVASSRSVLSLFPGAVPLRFDPQGA